MGGQAGYQNRRQISPPAGYALVAHCSSQGCPLFITHSLSSSSLYPSHLQPWDSEVVTALLLYSLESAHEKNSLRQEDAPLRSPQCLPQVSSFRGSLYPMSEGFGYNALVISPTTDGLPWLQSCLQCCCKLCVVCIIVLSLPYPVSSHFLSWVLTLIQQLAPQTLSPCDKQKLDVKRRYYPILKGLPFVMEAGLRVELI